MILQDHDSLLQTTNQIRRKYAGQIQLSFLVECKHRSLEFDNYLTTFKHFNLSNHNQINEYPCLIEVNDNKEHSDKDQGMYIDLTDLFTRKQPTPIKLGTIESIIGSKPNILIDKVSY